MAKNAPETEYVIIDEQSGDPDAIQTVDECLSECDAVHQEMTAALLAWLIRIQTACVTKAVSSLKSLIKANLAGHRIVEIRGGVVTNINLSQNLLLGKVFLDGFDGTENLNRHHPHRGAGRA